VRDAKTGTVAKCSSIKVPGTLKKGSGLSGAVNGCLGLVNNGDVQQASGTETVSPKQTITSP